MTKENIIKEKSCGAIIYRNCNYRVEFLLIKSINGIWGFPKGHVEENETEIDTAIREVFEETRLKIDIINGFRVEQKYSFKKGETIIDKEVVLFLATFSNQKPIAQESEISKIIFADYKKAKSLFQFEDNVETLKKANDYINKKNSSD